MSNLSNLPDEYVQKLYRRLSALIIGMPMSNKEFAAVLGLSEDVIEAWIKGKRYPKVQYLGIIAKTLGVSVDYLLCRTDDPKIITADEIRKRYYSRMLIMRKKEK